MLKTLEIDT